ncbi:MAG: serine carboxypeptidase [bacterium]|nr:serine carboxypeptidase [bacterium]
MPDKIEILSISIGSSKRDHEFMTSLLGRDYHVRRIGTDGDKWQAIQLIKDIDENRKAAVIGLGGADVFFRVGGRMYVHQDTKRFIDASKNTPVVDGAGLKQTLERWAIKWVLEKRPGLFNNKKILVMSGLDRWGIADVLGEYTKNFIFGDFMYALKIPIQLRTLKSVATTARWMMPILTNLPFEAIYPTGKRQETVRPIFQKPFGWADVIVGDFHYIRRYAPNDLEGKIVVTNTVTEDDVEDLKGRGVTTLITTTPEMGGRSFGTNVLEAIFVAHLKADGEHIENLSDSQLHDRYINLILKSGIEPRLIDLAPEHKPDIPKFSFVIHPITVDYLYRKKEFQFLKALPQGLVEESAAIAPPFFISKATGIKTPEGKEAVGYFYGLGATPKMMMKHPAEHFYRQMQTIAKQAQKKGATIMGLGAFTSVIGDAGVTVAKGSPIAVTSGNSYTTWATFETVKYGAEKLGINIPTARAMVIGATGSIGKAATKLMAEAFTQLVLVATKPERLMELARQLESQAENEGRVLKIDVSTNPDEYLPTTDIVVAASSAYGGIIDVMKLKSGALVCDVAMPPDVSEEEAGKRDDILVIASGEILIPGDVHWGVHLGLPKNVGFACLAETILLALEGMNENYTLGREIDIEKVKKIGEIGRKHGFKLAPVMAFNKVVSEEEIEQIKQRARR